MKVQEVVLQAIAKRVKESTIPGEGPGREDENMPKIEGTLGPRSVVKQFAHFPPVIWLALPFRNIVRGRKAAR